MIILQLELISQEKIDTIIDALYYRLVSHKRDYELYKEAYESATKQGSDAEGWERLMLQVEEEMSMVNATIKEVENKN